MSSQTMGVKECFKECFLATRPWSFTAALIPIVVTTAVLGKQYFLTHEFIRSLTIGVAVQAGANLSNTYFDYVNDVDTKNSTGEKTLVEKKLSTSTVIYMSVIMYLIAIAAILPTLMNASDTTLLTVFVIGVVLAYFYTANPIGLKYIALGDVTIFLCFGPLLMQCTSILLTGKTDGLLYIYSIPIGLLTEGILHANNARDIKADTKIGAYTLASLIGIDLSYLFYIFLFIGSYVTVVLISLNHHWGCVTTLLTLPLAYGLIKKFKDRDLLTLPEETAQMHLPFGLLLLFGILVTDGGLL